MTTVGHMGTRNADGPNGRTSALRKTKLPQQTIAIGHQSPLERCWMKVGYSVTCLRPCAVTSTPLRWTSCPT